MRIDGRPENVRACAEASLRRLRRRRHRPLLPAPGRPEGADRGHRRRDGRARRSRARSATSGCRRPAPPRSAGRSPSTRSRRCRASGRCGPATSRRRCWASPASTGSASCRSARSAAASSPARSPARDDFGEDDFRRDHPRFQGDAFAANLRLVDAVRELADREGRRRRSARAGLGAGPGRRRRPDPRHEAAHATWRRTSARPRSSSPPTTWPGSTRSRRPGVAVGGRYANSRLRLRRQPGAGRVSADRLLVAVFASPVAEVLVRVGRRARASARVLRRAGRRPRCRGARRRPRVVARASAELAGRAAPTSGPIADVVVTDPHSTTATSWASCCATRWPGRPAGSASWATRGTRVRTSPRSPRSGCPPEEIARVHRPIGLDIGSQGAGGDRRLHAGRAARRPQRPLRRLRARAADAADAGRRPARRRPRHQRAEARRAGRRRDASSPRPSAATRSTARRPGRAETDVRHLADGVRRRARRARPGAGRPPGAGAGDRPGRCTAPSSSTPPAPALRPALLWPDRRAAAELDRWRRAAAGRPRRAGQPAGARDDRADAGLAGAGTSRPSSRGRRRCCCPRTPSGPRSCRAPAAVTDRSDASATLLWDVVADGWSAAAVAAAGVPTGAAAARSGRRAEVVGTAALPVGEVPVVVGGADTPLALLAAGTAGRSQVNLGTGVQVLRPGPAAARRSTTRSCTATPTSADGWYAMAALQNGGSAWEWVLRRARPVAGRSCSRRRPRRRPGAGGVVFRPFLTGERGGVAGAGRPRRLDRPAPGDDPRRPGAGRGRGRRRSPSARRSTLLDVADGGEPVVLTGGGGAVGRRPAAARRRPAAGRSGTCGCAAPRRSGRRVLAGRGVGRCDVVPQRDAGPLVEPRPVAGRCGARRSRLAGGTTP